MDRDYEIFELLADGSPMWRGHASGLHEVRLLLDSMVTKTKNECVAMHLPTREIIARVNVGGSNGRTSKPLGFQIAYGDNTLALARKEVLKLHGYEAVSAIGNEAAKLILDLDRSWDFFIVSNGAPAGIHEDMVAWLKGRFPGVSVLAVNDSTVAEVAGADYNVKEGAPELCVAVLDKEFGGDPQRPKTAGE